MRFCFIAVLSLLMGTGCFGASFQNGSFESGAEPGSFATLASGSTAIDGWVVGGHSVDYIGSYWQASDGARSLDLNGDGKGSIAQMFDTLAGQRYLVRFDLAGNPDGAPAVKTVVTSAAGDSLVWSFDASGSTHSAMGWTEKSFSFMAASSATTLTFSSDIDGSYGAALDNVRVDAVPEPGSFVLLGSAMGVVWFAARRRSR